MRRTRTPPPASHSTAGQTSCCVSVELGHTGVSGWSWWPVSWAFTGFHKVSLLCLSRLIYIFFFSSCFPSVWPRQRWQNLSGWAAAGEWICLSCKWDAESQYGLRKQLVHAVCKSVRWWIIRFQRCLSVHYYYLWKYLPFGLYLTKEQMLLWNLPKCSTEREISTSMRRLCPCADNDVISHLNYRLIFPRQSNILYFGFPLCYLLSFCEAVSVSVTLCDL